MAVKPKGRNKKATTEKKPNINVVSGIRELAPNRSMRLFVDQVQTLEELAKDYDINVNINEIVRSGVDLMIEQAKEQLKSKN